jgi:anti-sigma regulatory factor (Ser/Thr protein kinase)
MTKRLVDQILDQARAEHWDEVERLTGEIEPRFLRSRLARLKESDPTAVRVWARLYPGTTDAPLPSDLPRAEPEAARPPPVAHPDPTARPVLPAADLPEEILLETPGPFLTAVNRDQPFSVHLERVHVVQIWALAALAALSRRNGHTACQVDGALNSAGKFAHAVGLHDVVEKRTTSPGEIGRTVKLTRLSEFDRIEPTAREISKLILLDAADEESRRAIYYVLVELLRNVVQHSQDPLGGVVAAQLMDERQRYPRRMIQVAVADAGIGIPRALSGMHPDLRGPEEALEKALWPHYSGTFEEGLTGSQQNAGMGLFFISEMAKLTGGRLLVASRGATLFLRGDPKDIEKHSISILQPKGVGFPGTLVAFELPIGEVPDYEGLIQTIGDRAKKRVPQRAVENWLRFVDQPPPGSSPFLVFRVAEDTVAAGEISTKLRDRAVNQQPIALDFRNLDICTQSYLHALLFEPLRHAWASRTPIYVLNAAPGVRSGLELLERYALGG